MNTMVVVLVVVPVTTLDHVVDHNWSVGVPRLGKYIWVSKYAIFREKHVAGGTSRGADDHS